MTYLSRTLTAVVLLAVLLTTGCARLLPWGREPVGDEVNMAFQLENNLLYLPGLDVDGRSGRFIFASAAARSVLDPDFAPRARNHSLQISKKQSLRFSPGTIEMRGVADGIIGADVWGRHAVTIDYRSGLLTYQKAGIFPAYMSLYQFDGEPEATIVVDGRAIRAVIDTSSPDTLVLPGSTDRRTTSHIALGGADLGPTDIRYAPVERPRIGNRVLSRFLITIDYGKKVAGFWRDPRIPLREPDPMGGTTVTD